MKHDLCLVFLILVSLVSCNQVTVKDSENQVSDEFSKSRETEKKDSIERERIFTALGDTIFGHVLYGMNESDARAAINDFQNSLPESQAKMFRFTFSGIEFYDINEDIVNSDKIDFDKLKHAYKKQTIIWNEKLCSVIWHSRELCTRTTEEIETQLNTLCSFFENKYGKPNIKKNNEAINRSILIDNDRKLIFAGTTYTTWETHDRAIEILLDGKNCPGDGSGTDWYVYYIVVRFYNKTIMKEISSFLEQEETHNIEEFNEKIRQDSIKAANAL